MLESCRQHMEFHAGRRVDPALVDIFVRMKFEEYRQFLYAHEDMESTVNLVKLLTDFSEAGFIRLMEDLRKDEDLT